MSPSNYNRYKCQHNRTKYRCIDCGTGRCIHGRDKYRCMDCGTGHCVSHNKPKHAC